MACEKCWSSAYRMMLDDMFESQAEAYESLMSPPRGCTPDEQCGVGTTEMHTIHQGEKQCACGRRKKFMETEASNCEA